MATITNIRIYTQSKAVPNAGYIAIDKVMMEGNTIVAMGGDVRYVLGVVPMENIVVDTPSMPKECGCNTANANIFATLIKGVDGITPDMSDYYNKGQVDNKLSTKQDAIADIDNIRRNALKGATALQSVPSEYVTETELQNKGYATTAQVGAKQDKISDLDNIRSGAEKGATAVQPASLADYVSKDEVDAELSDTSTNPVQNQAVTNSFSELVTGLEGLLEQKQPVISDLEAIRDGAAKGATALQEHQPLKTINGESIIGEGDITIEGGGGGGGGDLSGYATEEYVNNAVAEVNVKGEDGYVYSNGEKVDMRFTRSLIPVGTSIPAKANLNTVEYLKVGKYYCSLNADAKTITNCPTASAFMMEVFNLLSTVVDNEVDSTYVYRIRIITEYSTGIQYFQYCTVGSTANRWTYDSWYVCPRTKFTLNSNKNDGSAAIGSKAQGVYVDSTGTLQKMTYSLNKTVPANAVFTDTDTKVTAVGNHYTPVENANVVIEAPEGEVVIGLKRDAAGHVVGVMSTPMSGGGSGGGGITKESDPVFSASPAATITEEKMSAWDGKQDAISDLDDIRSGAEKGATAVQPASLADYVSKDDVDAELSDTSTNPVQNQAVTNSFSELVTGLEGLLEQKQPVISDLEAIRDGAAKGATAVQPETLSDYALEGYVDSEIKALGDSLSEVATSGSYSDLSDKPTFKTINNESILGSGNITISGGGGASGSAQLPANYISSNIAQGCIIPSGKVTIFSIPQTEGVTMRLSTVDMESGKDNSWVIRFSIGADNTGVYVVESEDNFSLKWANGIAPTFENGKYYEMSFRLIGTMFLGVWASFE